MWESMPGQQTHTPLHPLPIVHHFSAMLVKAYVKALFGLLSWFLADRRKMERSEKQFLNLHKGNYGAFEPVVIK